MGVIEHLPAKGAKFAKMGSFLCCVAVPRSPSLIFQDAKAHHNLGGGKCLRPGNRHRPATLPHLTPSSATP